MTQNFKAPKLRFPGFTEDWEQRKVAQYASFLAGNGLNWNDIANDGKKECILYGNLYTDYGMIADKVIYKTNAEINKPVYSEFGDVLIPASDTTPTGLARATSIEKSGVLLGGDINIIRPNKGINGSCLSLAFNANKNELIRLIKGTTVRHIHNSDIRDIIISLPKDENEQVKISMYFKQLDNLITLHQRKFETLKKLKKGFLQKMFPKNGESVPEIRFPGFTDAWEQRKLEDMASFSKGSGYSKSDLIDSGTPLILYGRLYTKYETVITEVDTYAEEKKGSVFSKGGEVIVPASGETAEDISVASVVEKSEVLLGGDLNVITPSEVLESMFLALNITYGKAHKDMSKLAQGKSVVHLHNADLKTIVLQYPSILEQRKICEFFKSLDNLITLHQRKLDILKKLKQGMLQQMFI
jgi:type I restriction enzyme S subunit